MLTTLFNGITFFSKLAFVFFITLFSLGFITSSIFTGPRHYSTCMTHSYIDPGTNEQYDCVVARGKLYCDEERQTRLLNATVTALEEVGNLLVLVLELQQQQQQGDGGVEGSGVDEDDIQWGEASVKGVRVKKVDGGGAARGRNGSKADGALVVEL